MKIHHKIREKAQAAMEFLMVYGWAILVVVIVIGALTYLVDFKSLVGNKCQLTAPLYCNSYKAEVGKVTLLIKNSLSQQITVSSIELIDEGCTDSAFTTSTIVASGETTFEVDCAGITSGEKVKTDVNIIYDEADGLAGMIATGNLIVKVAGTANGGGTTDPVICQNAQDSGLCGGLDIAYWEGYQAACCSEHPDLCC